MESIILHHFIIYIHKPSNISNFGGDPTVESRDSMDFVQIVTVDHLIFARMAVS